MPAPDRRRSSPLARLRHPLMAFAAGAALLAGGLAGPAHAEGEATIAATPSYTNRLDGILARGVLRVGTTGDYKPFSYRVGTTDTFVGSDLELAGDLARSLGVTMQIVPTTWGALMNDLAADRFDVAMGGVSVTLDRQRRAMYSVPYLRDGKTPIARCPDATKYAALAQINQPDVRLIVNPGGTNERFARAHAPLAKLTVWPDNVTIFDRIVAGEADVMITDAIEARLQSRLHPQLCAIHPEAPFDFSEKAVLMPRDAVLKAYVDQWLHQSVETGRFRQVQERWLDYPWGLEALRAAIERRLQLAPDVARFKWNAHTDIEDGPRERQVIDRMSDEAASLGVPKGFARAFFRAQVEANKTVQREMFMGWKVLKTGQLTDVPDLQTVTRPKIDAVNAEMVHVLAAVWPLLSNPERQADVARALRPIEAESLSMKAVEQAVEPLLDVRKHTAAAEAATPGAGDAVAELETNPPAAGPAAAATPAKAASAAH